MLVAHMQMIFSDYGRLFVANFSLLAFAILY